MDLIYSVTRKCARNSSIPNFQNCDSLHDGHTLCTISSQNIVAFTTTTELDDYSGNSWGSHVYVADMNTPWHSHKVFSNKLGITALEWDLPGDKLLIADTDGNVQLWTFKDNVLNDWVCLGTAAFPGEHILGAAFFHNGRKIGLVAEKKDSYLYSDKFSHLRFAPSVRHFGSRPTEGFLVISTTGMIGVVQICFEGSTITQLATTSDSLALTRNRITAVDICYGKNGHFLVAVNGGSVSLPVQCYRVSVKLNDEKCVIMSQALPSFFMQSNSIKDNQCRHVAQLKFVVREDADSLVVAANGENSCLVEIWELREKPLPIHKLFQAKGLQTQPEGFKTVLWQHQSHFTAQSPVVCVSTSKLSVTTTMPPPCYVTVALADGTIHCLYRESLKQIASTSLHLSWRQEDAAPSSKYQRLSSHISHMDMSWLGCVLMVIDSQGQLYLYRLLPIAEPGGPMTVPYACTLLEYCLVSGLDWWDLLVSLRPSMLETVCDRFTESFNRQLHPVQQFYYTTYLNIKTSLYRLTISGQSKVADLTSLLMLYSVANAFRALLRPSESQNHEKTPADCVQAAMKSDNMTDVLLHLEAKEFAVEPSHLQSMQQLIQWVADLALNILAKLPEQRQSGKVSGYELIRDFKALHTLREILIIIRIWGLLIQSCLPVFVRSSDNFDALAVLFKLISRLAQNPDQPDENLIDECCLLPNQVLIPQLNPPLKITCVASPLLFFQSLPLQLEFSTEPDSLQFVPDINPVEGALQTEQMMDSIRHMFLGKQPLVVKECSRCGGKAQLYNIARTAAIRSWEQRWLRTCRCGGHWRIHRYM